MDPVNEKMTLELAIKYCIEGIREHKFSPEQLERLRGIIERGAEKSPELAQFLQNELDSSKKSLN